MAVCVCPREFNRPYLHRKLYLNCNKRLTLLQAQNIWWYSCQYCFLNSVRWWPVEKAFGRSLTLWCYQRYNACGMHTECFFVLAVASEDIVWASTGVDSKIHIQFEYFDRSGEWQCHSIWKYSAMNKKSIYHLNDI